MIYFPKDIWIKIYSYDPTFKNYFDLHIIPLLKKQWYVSWTCKYTGKFGFDLSIENYGGDFETIFSYYECKKLCDKNNKTNSANIFIPYNSRKTFSFI